MVLKKSVISGLVTTIIQRKQNPTLSNQTFITIKKKTNYGLQYFRYRFI